MNIVATIWIMISAMGLSSGAFAHRIDCNAPLVSYKQYLVVMSKFHYYGPCPCPYSIDHYGYICGQYSAYYKSGPYAPLCFPEDVTDEMLRDFLKQYCPRRKVR